MIDAYSATGSWTSYPQTLPPEYYAAIGEVCARWSWLEFQLGVIAREAIGIRKPAGFSAFGGMNMKQITEALIALTLSEFPKNKPRARAAISNIATTLLKHMDMRNEYAHAIWGYEKRDNPQLGVWKLRKPDNRVKPNWVNKPLATIHHDAQFLAGLQVMAQEITDALKNRPSKYA